MSVITIASSSVTANVLSGNVMLPLIGVWTADLIIDQPDGVGFEAETAVTITAGDIELNGTVAKDRSGDFLDAVHVRVLGGAGGMTKPVSLRSYVQPGALIKDVVNGLMSDSGETLSDTTDQGFLNTNLTAWSVMNGLVSNGVETLLFFAAPEKHWRILTDGKFWVGDEAWDTITPEVEIMQVNPAERTTLLGVSAPSIVPGVTLQEVGRVSRVEHTFDSGMIRSQVWTEIEGEQRGIVPQLQAIIRQEMAGIDYQAFYQFKVQDQSSDLLTVNINPVEPNDSRLHGMNNVPVRFGTATKVQFVTGATVMLGWNGGDPRFPYVCDGLGSDSAQRIQIAGNTDAARKDDPITHGSLVFTFTPAAGPGVVTGGQFVLVYTPGDGTATQTITTVGTMTVQEKILSGSSLVGLG